MRKIKVFNERTRTVFRHRYKRRILLTNRMGSQKKITLEHFQTSESGVNYKRCHTNGNQNPIHSGWLILEAE